MKPETLQRLLAHITENATPIDREDRFDAMLDECYSFEAIGGPFASMIPSRVLKEIDPTAYRCGVNDYADGEEWVEIDGSYYDSDEVDTAREEIVSEMESELTDLEAQLEDGEGKQLDLEKQIEELEAEIAAVEKHSF